MGLDMYAYTAAKAHDHTSESESREIAYWRKHPNLHGWMHKLWEEKIAAEGKDSTDNFNGIELELTWEDLDRLEYVVNNNELPATTGFFFGEPADDYYKDRDLEFIRKARAELFTGLKVFYNSSW
jgi:hypothetical protein